MKALIKPADYCSSAVYKKEQTDLFQKSWYYVGNTAELQNENDFITHNIGGIPVVVQMMKGELRCFRNVCSHRHSLLQTQPRGNRALFCPYHGWSFKETGALQAVPKKPLFQFSKEEMDCLGLQSFQMEQCGTLVFVRVSAEGPDLKTYLGDFYDELATISSSFGVLIDLNEMVINANWKILVENTLESYHVNLIHTNTFRKLGASGLSFQIEGLHSSWDAPLAQRENEGKQERVHRPFQDRAYKIEGYKHLLCFPNILVSTTYGISFNLSAIVPLDEHRSLFRSYVYLTKDISAQHNEALLQAYKNSLISFNRQVFDEDKAICEQVQIGVQASPFDGELSDEEMRVCAFQESYVAFLKNSDQDELFGNRGDFWNRTGYSSAVAF